MCLSKILGIWQDSKEAGCVMTTETMQAGTLGITRWYGWWPEVPFHLLYPPSNLILHGSGQIGELCRLNFLPTKWNRGSELNSVRKSWMVYSLHAWIYKLKFISKIILKTRICLKDLGIYSIHIQCLYLDPFTLSYFKYANIYLHVYLPNQILSFLKAGTMLSSFLCSE